MWDTRDEDNEDINTFDLRHRDIELNLFLEYIWSKFLYFQNKKYKVNMFSETVFIIFIFKISCKKLSILKYSRHVKIQIIIIIILKSNSGVDL
jgi:hypothetical protein